VKLSSRFVRKDVRGSNKNPTGASVSVHVWSPPLLNDLFPEPEIMFLSQRKRFRNGSMLP